MPGYRIRIDPEERETQALAALGGAQLNGRVLEVGCGDGRLTWRYAHRARGVVAIDPDPVAIDAARNAIPDSLRDRVEFRCTGIADLTATPSSFDLAVLAWSL